MVRRPEGAAPRAAEDRDFYRRLSAALASVRRSIDELLASFWEEAWRIRVCDQATALAQAARLEGRIRIFVMARAMASIGLIGREDAFELRSQVEEKLRELLGELDAECIPERGRESV